MRLLRRLTLSQARTVGVDAAFVLALVAVAAFPPEVRRYALIVDPTAPSRVTETGGLVVVQVADKADLGALLRWTQR